MSRCEHTYHGRALANAKVMLLTIAIVTPLRFRKECKKAGIGEVTLGVNRILSVAMKLSPLSSPYLNEQQKNTFRMVSTSIFERCQP